MLAISIQKCACHGKDKSRIQGDKNLIKPSVWWLKEMGITEEMIPGLVAHSMTDPSNATTPRLPTQDEWEKLFLDAM